MGIMAEHSAPKEGQGNGVPVREVRFCDYKYLTATLLKEGFEVFLVVVGAQTPNIGGEDTQILRVLPLGGGDLYGA